jgi:hypothetical protein
MKKNLNSNSIHRQSNPAAGIPHVQELNQASMIFILEDLNEEIKELNKNINSYNEQSTKLSITNIRLQRGILILTGLGVMVAGSPFIKMLVVDISSYLSLIFNKPFNINDFSLLISIMTTVISFLLGILTYFAGRRIVKGKFSDSVSINDELDMILMDKDGKIKEHYNSNQNSKTR